MVAEVGPGEAAPGVLLKQALEEGLAEGRREAEVRGCHRVPLVGRVEWAYGLAPEEGLCLWSYTYLEPVGHVRGVLDRVLDDVVDQRVDALGVERWLAL